MAILYFSDVLKKVGLDERQLNIGGDFMAEFSFLDWAIDLLEQIEN